MTITRPSHPKRQFKPFHYHSLKEKKSKISHKSKSLSKSRSRSKSRIKRDQNKAKFLNSSNKNPLSLKNYKFDPNSTLLSKTTPDNINLNKTQVNSFIIYPFRYLQKNFHSIIFQQLNTSALQWKRKLFLKKRKIMKVIVKY